ncbi:hypothetical protein [Pseudomonas fluorescens]|uniref:hypothetical protein n=1 Tax=Pseudomonas fluorescens TaxID=294 RepID=UPI00123F0604|nr:hypothetical protein [Pseudomonas fluorescens]
MTEVLRTLFEVFDSFRLLICFVPEPHTDALSGTADREKAMNGWQRLWLVASVVVAVAISVLRYEQFPTQEKIASEHRYNITFWRGCKTYYQEMDAGKFNRDSPCSSYKRQHAEQSLENELEAYKYKLGLLSERQFQWVATSLGYWLGVNVAALLALFAVRWIIRGFRPKQT